MIRVYFALSLLLASGIALYATGIDALKIIGGLEIIAATLGLHAHYTQE